MPVGVGYFQIFVLIIGSSQIKHATAATPPLPNGVCQYSSLAVLASDAKRNGFQPVSQFLGCSYAVADKSFLDLVDTSAAPRVVAKSSIPFAHEAPVWLPGLNKVFFASNRLGDTNSSNQYIELQLLDVSSGAVSKLPSSLSDRLLMGNGATNWPGTDDSIALLTQGRGDKPGEVDKVNLRSMTAEVQLNSYFGRRFNSPNDIAFYKDGKTLFFTDPPYGFAQKFKPAPELGNYVYSFNIDTKIPSVAADGFLKPNGVAFSPDFSQAYVTDTGMADGTTAPLNPANPQTIYVYDVATLPAAGGRGVLPLLRNRRTFAVADAGVPDGIKLDSRGNVYAGTGAGVEVFAPTGQRLGTVFIPGGVANLVFGGDKKDVLYALAEKHIFAIKMKVPGAKLP
eukprot:gene11781-11926_t